MRNAEERAEPWPSDRPRLGALHGITTFFGNRLFALIVGSSGASPPYGVVKLPSVFLVDFHVL
jgi:hypothetical protein